MRRWRCGLCAAMLLSSVCAALAASAAVIFAVPAFQTQWEQGEALVPNFWGPPVTVNAGTSLAMPDTGHLEGYAEASGGKRNVQYFDKGRMELTNGTVTNGLLATELVTGRFQFGDTSFRPQPSPAIPIAGDADNPAPTYAQLGTTAASLLAPTPQRAAGTAVATGIDAGGHVVGMSNFANSAAAIAAYDAPTQHNVIGAFAQYRDHVGLLTIGYAISEPFVATTLKVAGRNRVVMVQVFERRVLTYTADNPDPFKVEMGNIGQHYYQWRYGSAPVTAAPSTGGAAGSPCVKACVLVDSAQGPGLAGVTICQGFASYGGEPVGTTDATGAYQAMVRSTQGHQETVNVWPHKAGYTFMPPYLTSGTSTGGEVIETTFIAQQSSAAPTTDACGSPPFIK